MPFHFTKEQARRFLLRRHGLTGEYIFDGEDGILRYIDMTGGVQYDPVDVCGRSADIALHARVKHYTTAMLSHLLYADKPAVGKPAARKLIDFFDKNLCIIKTEDFPAMLRARAEGFRSDGVYAAVYDARGGEAVQKLKPLIKQLIAERGHVAAHEVPTDESIEWHWGTLTSLPRAALESMYFNGELVVHHKTRTHKHYAFTEDYIAPEVLSAALPFQNRAEKNTWHVARRVGAVGLLWNKSSDAFLGMKLKGAERAEAFAALLERGALTQVNVTDIVLPLYARSDELLLLEEIASGAEYKPRAAFLAPLDCLMWDRKLIEALFGFSYTWEIYTPAVKRKYAAYTLPFLYDEKFYGRAELTRQSGKIRVANLWKEDGVKWTKKTEQAFEQCVTEYGKCFNL